MIHDLIAFAGFLVCVVIAVISVLNPPKDKP